jgi:hypothetical protein
MRIRISTSAKGEIPNRRLDSFEVAICAPVRFRIDEVRIEAVGFPVGGAGAEQRCFK